MLRRLLFTGLIAVGLLVLLVSTRDERMVASGVRTPPAETADAAGQSADDAPADELLSPDVGVPETPTAAPRPTFAPTATALPAFESSVQDRGAPEEDAVSGQIAAATHETLIPGDGLIQASAQSRLLVEYVAFLAADGSPFDSTWNVPGTVKLDMEALPLPALAQELVGVSSGERRRVLLPAESGYGSSGLGELVPPDSDLIFVVDVARVELGRAVSDQPDSPVPGDAITELSTDDVQVGTGVVAEEGDRVSVHFVARFAESGDVWESTWATGFSTAFTLGQETVIQGFEQGIEGMAEGGRRVIEVPASLAFGTEGAADRGVAPNESFVFVVDLLEVGDSAGR